MDRRGKTRVQDKGAELIPRQVKTNIGHSEAASGLSALIKAILTVEKGIIPPTRGLVKPSLASKWNMYSVFP